MSTDIQRGMPGIGPAVTRACQDAGAAAASEVPRSDLPIHMDAMIAAMWEGFNAAHQAIEAERIAADA
ncbi:MAG: hypothetical protein AAF415_02390 [Pseudomonadota bacterium]